MPVDNFSGETFVSFLDISGFKEMMKDDNKAIHALSVLYESGYDILSSNSNINGFFISDSGVLFTKDITSSMETRLFDLLSAVERINRILLNDDIMLTTSISFGQFKYNRRLEFLGIEKNLIYGNAYVSAFLDNEIGTPKIQPGQCRIVFREQDRELITCIENINSRFRNRFIRKNNHFYFYWMVDTEAEIAAFERRYSDSYQLKYRGMLTALKNESNR